MPQTKTQLEEALFATLAYFDIHDYPLTLLELQQWLWGCRASTPEVFAVIEQHPEVENTMGMYHLKGRSEIVTTRLARYAITEKKFRKRRYYLRFLASLPYVETVCITNSLALFNANEESDLDIAIITQPGRLWSTRFFATLPAKLLKLRPRITPQHVDKKDKICLCFYATPEHLKLANERITAPDIDFVYWIATMLPIYNRNHHYETFLEQNQWIRQFLPNLEPIVPVSSRMLQPLLLPLFRTFIKLMSRENWLKKIQYRILPDVLRNLANAPDTRVVINDAILKLHPRDQRRAIQSRWQQKIEKHRKNPQRLIVSPGGSRAKTVSLVLAKRDVRASTI